MMNSKISISICVDTYYTYTIRVTVGRYYYYYFASEYYIQITWAIDEMHDVY